MGLWCFFYLSSLLNTTFSANRSSQVIFSGRSNSSKNQFGRVIFQKTNVCVHEKMLEVSNSGKVLHLSKFYRTKSRNGNGARTRNSIRTDRWSPSSPWATPGPESKTFSPSVAATARNPLRSPSLILIKLPEWWMNRFWLDQSWNRRSSFGKGLSMMKTRRSQWPACRSPWGGQGKKIKIGRVTRAAWIAFVISYFCGSIE